MELSTPFFSAAGIVLAGTSTNITASGSFNTRPSSPLGHQNGQKEQASATPVIQNNGSISTDPVTLSPDGINQAARSSGAANSGDDPTNDNIGNTGSPNTTENTNNSDSTQSNETAHLTEQQLAELRQLKQRDAEVKAHEQAHLSAAGQYAKGGASFTYQRGPDGSSYAVGGEVGIDISKESSPEATILKMRTIKRAALAPATPSGADKRIAAQASATEARARQEILQVKQEELLQGQSSSGQAAKEPTPQPVVPSSDQGSSYGSLKSKLAVYQQMMDA